MYKEDSPFNYIYLKDHLNRSIGIEPEAIHSIVPTNNFRQCLIWFSGGNLPLLFNHSIYEVVKELDTFYHAN